MTYFEVGLRAIHVTTQVSCLNIIDYALVGIRAWLA